MSGAARLFSMWFGPASNRKPTCGKTSLRLEVLEDRRVPALFVVNTLADTVDADADVTSFREALLGADANPGADTIRFNVAGSIGVATLLPNLADASGGTTIDATTAPGYAGTPVVSLVGPGSSVNGLEIHAAGNTVRGLHISNFNIGIALGHATNCRIERNTITANGSDGIQVVSSVDSGHLFDRNSLFGNGGLGINLVSATDNAAGVTPNDPGDADTGPNGLQNYPVLTSAVSSPAGTSVAYALNSSPNTGFNLQFYSSPAADADPSGYGEGRSFVASVTVTTDIGGNFSGSILLPVLPIGNVITATAATPAAQSTSEFSAAVAVTDSTTRIWDGGGATGNWSDPLNWQGDQAPQAGAHLVFGPSTDTSLVNDFAPGTSFGSLKFTAGGFVLDGNALKVGAGIEVTAAAGSSVTMNVDVSIANDLLPYIEQDNLLPYIEQDNVLILHGRFTGDFGLQKLGRGTMILNAANTYTGATNIEQGMLRLQNGMALGSAAGATVLREGARLELDNVQVMGETLTIQSSGGFLQGELRSVSGTNSWTGPIQLPTGLDPICSPIRSLTGSVMTLSGVISGGNSAEVAKFGAGTLVLSGVNTFGGQAKVREGVVSIRSSQALGSNAGDTVLSEGARLELENVQVMGETLTIQPSGGFLQGELRSVSGNNSWTGPIQLPNNIDPICNPIRALTGSVMTLSGVISGGNSAEIAKFGAGTLVLSGVNTFGGQAKVREGVVSIRSSQALGSNAGDTVLSEGARLELENVQVMGETLTIQPSGGFLQGELRSVSGNNSWTGPIQLPNNIEPVCSPIRSLTGSVMTLSGVISGGNSAEIAKFGAGTLVLSGANTFGGQAKVREGIVSIRSSLALGSNAGDTVLSEGARLELENVQVIGETLTIQPSGGFLQGELRSVSGNNSWAGPIQLPHNIEPICAPIRSLTGSVMTLSGVISGGNSAEVAKFGAGTLVLSGANTFGGQAKVVDGVVRIENAMALGSTAANTRLVGGTLELRGGISVLGESLAVDAGPAEIHSATGANTWTGAWTIDPIDVPIVVETGSTMTAAGVLSGVGGLHKDGVGTFVLSGANTYAGVTHVAAGTLTIRSNLALGSTTGITEVFTGATLGLRDSVLVSGEALELHGDSKLTSGGGSNTWTGAISLRSDPPIDVETGSVLELTGAIDGAENLQKLGGGDLIVSGASPAYTGVLQVFAGTLVLNGALPNASIELAGGTLGGSGAVASVTIHGTAGADAIKINPAAGAGRVDAIVNGVRQGIFRPTLKIIVLAGAGDDDVQVAGSIAVSAWLYGEAGEDQLKGGAGYDVLLGGANDDHLNGGSGDDLLIGGTGADRIIGNAGDDLQIAGATAFDADAAALAAIMAEWTSTRDYVTRIANLTGPGSAPRSNAGYFLKTDGPSATVFDDAAKDMLTGSSGLSWFFANLDTGVLDKITDLSSSEFAADVDAIGP